MSERKPTISLCMIARDAEPSLDRALLSARPFMDEIIVIDTGSRDASRRIAAEHGARVFDFAWCDSFSAARNHSLAQATGDWIFWMDADDVLPKSSGHLLRQLIGACPDRNAAFWVNVHSTKPGTNGGPPRVTAHGHVKLFPRRDDIRFRYRVHEKIAPAIQEIGLPIRRSRAVVRHMADRSPAAQEARRARNLRLARLDQAEHPHDPYVLLSLGLTHLSLPGALPAAAEYLRHSVDACSRGADIQLGAYVYLGRALALSGKRNEEEQVYREALAAFPDEMELLMRLGQLCERSGRLSEAIATYRRILSRGVARPSGKWQADGRMRVALRLGQLLIRLGQRLRAEELWRKYLKRNPRARLIESALRNSWLETFTVTVGGQ